ncbi:MAG: hypothetical protein FJX73_07290 [Armatimonadetes bacterium]|nr:hypothetical protein [Armatimonadota bacterium]
MEQDNKGLTERISFAENWLARARQQVEDGHRERGLLTLVLAAAEVRLAREAGGPAARLRPDRRALSGWIAAGMTVLSAATLIFLVVPRTAGPTDVHSGQAPPVVFLSGGTGAMLDLVTVPPPAAEKTVTRTIIVRVPVTITKGAAPQAAPATAPSRPAARHVPAGPPLPSPATAVTAGSTAPPPALLSEADMIELVLAAERSLRRSAGH